MKIFGIGMRNIKTAISVFIILVVCGTFSYVTGIYSTGFYGAIAAIICIQNSSEMTMKMGQERVAGSFIGAVVALSFYTIIGMPEHYVETAFIIAIALIIAIHLTNILKLPFASSVSAIIIVSCFTVVPKDAICLTIMVRCIETALGVIVASVVNNYIFPYKKIN